MIALEPYSDEWPIQFGVFAAEVYSALGPAVTAIEHIGSTAVPGLVAKPTIDLAARAAPGVDPFELGSRLGDVGYFRHRRGPKNHGVYVKTADGRRLCIVHAFAADAWERCNQRAFGDKLLRDSAARTRYATLKLRAASERSDGAEYTQDKSALIQELLDEELAERGWPPSIAWDK